MRRSSRGLIIAGLITAAVAMESSVRADELVLEPIVRERTGWFAGGSIGRGGLDITHGCGSCPALQGLREALSLSGHVGLLLNPRLGLGVEAWMVRYAERDNLRFADSSEHMISEQMLLASAQVWPIRFVWLRAGVGAAWHQTDLEYPIEQRPLPASSKGGVMPTSDGGIGPAAGVALGIELAHTPTFGFDIAVRTGAAAHDSDVAVTMTGITVGGTWY